MVALQILSKVLQTADDSIIVDNMLTVEYFIGFEDEYNFIMEHKDKYGNVPDKETFQAKFPNFEMLEVNEPDRYLVETIREENSYAVAVPIINKYAELLKSDANEANEYLASQMSKLQPNYCIGGVDIIHNADKRYEEYLDRRNNQKEWYFESGFPELDDLLGGIQRKEEFVVIVARLGQGKSWQLLKIAGHIWKTGFNVGYVSPEMSHNAVGFRFDTLLGHFSNKDLMHGRDVAQYDQHLDMLKERKNKFVVTTPIDFNREITVSKLRNFVKQNKLVALFIDGIKYLRDERGRKGDNTTTSLTNISEDLIELSVEVGIPVIVVVQSNRGGASSSDEDGAPKVEDIRDSDGIGQCATKILSLKQKTGGVLEIDLLKNRYGIGGGRVDYLWDIDKGDYINIPIAEKAKSRRSDNSSEGGRKNSNTNVF